MSRADEEKDDRSDGGEVGPTLDADPGIARVGGKIDRYKLISVLGEGGCGMVYLAEQRTPVTQRVALKVIKPGVDTKGSARNKLDNLGSKCAPYWVAPD